MNNTDLLEKEKSNVIEMAEKKFGKEYFDQLDKLTQDFLENDEVMNYTLTTNYEGAFYAYTK